MIRVIDHLTEGVSRCIRWLTLLMVLITVVVVVLRYGFSIGAIALQESVMYMHGLVFLLGIPYGLKRDTHVRVDLIYSRLNAGWRRRINLVGHCLFLLPVAVFITYISTPYALAAWRVLEGSSEVGGINGVFLLKSLLPLMGLLLTAQAIAEIIRQLKHDPNDAEPDSTPDARS